MNRHRPCHECGICLDCRHHNHHPPTLRDIVMTATWIGLTIGLLWALILGQMPMHDIPGDRIHVEDFVTDIKK